MSKQGKDRMIELEYNLSDTFMARADIGRTGFSKSMPSHAQLVSEQKADPTLHSLFQEAVSEDDITEEACGCFLSNESLMRKWTSPKMSSDDAQSRVFQTVLDLRYCV